MTAGNRDVHTWLTARVATYLRRSPEDIDTSVPLADYGLDSLTALAITADIEDEFEVTVDDPKAYTTPWTVTLKQRIVVDTELIDEICLENEQSAKRMK